MPSNNKFLAVPRHLTGRRARRTWRELAPQIADAGRLNAATAPLLAVLCSFLADALQRPQQITVPDVNATVRLMQQLGLDAAPGD